MDKKKKVFWLWKINPMWILYPGLGAFIWSLFTVSLYEEYGLVISLSITIGVPVFVWGLWYWIAKYDDNDLKERYY